MYNKLLKGEGIIEKDTTYERKLNYSILIFNIAEYEKTTTIFIWKDSLKKIEKYTYAYVGDNTIDMDEYIEDTEDTEPPMYSLNLEKKKDGTWQGKLRKGSAIHSMTFKEY